MALTIVEQQRQGTAMRILLYPGPDQRWWVHLHHARRGIRHSLDLDPPVEMDVVLKKADEFLATRSIEVEWRQIEQHHPVWRGELVKCERTWFDQGSANNRFG